MSTGCRYATTGPTTIAVARWWSTATPVPYPEWQNNTLCIDTGCVFGGGADGAALSRA